VNPLQGLAIWIWELDKCEGGNLAAIVAKARVSGVSSVIVKAGEEAANGQVTAALVATFRTAGIEPAIWWYCRPKDFDAQLGMLKALQDRCGVTGFVMDAEAEWDTPDNRPAATQFAARLRAELGPDAWLADAPWSRPVKHGGFFPYAQFGAVMNARMPQFYWELAKPEEATPFLADCDLEWQQTAPGQSVCPALCTVNEDGTKHAPVSELAAALDRYAARPLVSIWSWQHLNAAEWALLAQRARTKAPIADPLAGAPVAGLVIPEENA
jgi:hypothetical protein